MKDKPHYKYQIQSYAQNNLKCFVFKVEIQQKTWHWKVGDTIEVPILAKSEMKANDVFDDAFWGSEYPQFQIIEVREIKGDFLFGLQIQRNVLDVCFDLGVEKGKSLKQ